MSDPKKEKSKQKIGKRFNKKFAVADEIVDSYDYLEEEEYEDDNYDDEEDE